MIWPINRSARTGVLVTGDQRVRLASIADTSSSSAARPSPTTGDRSTNTRADEPSSTPRQNVSTTVSPWRV